MSAPTVKGSGRQNGLKRDELFHPAVCHRRTRDSRTAVVLASREAERRAEWRSPPHVTSGATKQRLLKIFADQSSIDGDTQKKRLLIALTEFDVTTLEARRYLDVQAVSARIRNLKGDGHMIVTTRVLQATELGRTRIVAQYKLIGDSTQAE